VSLGATSLMLIARDYSRQRDVSAERSQSINAAFCLNQATISSSCAAKKKKKKPASKALLEISPLFLMPILKQSRVINAV